MLQSVSDGIFASLTLLLLVACGSFAVAQPETRSAPSDSADLAEAQASLIEKTTAYKTSIADYLNILESETSRKSKLLADARILHQRGFISHEDLLKSERDLEEVQNQTESQRQRLTEADHALAEAEARLAQLLSESGRYQEKPFSRDVQRYWGSAAWTLAEAAEMANFFWSRFGRELPISAYGQTPTHDTLGFDHRNQVDVAVHPDSPEGQALIAYLKDRQISFIGFGDAVSGKATGAHIHVGPPSSKGKK